VAESKANEGSEADFGVWQITTSIAERKDIVPRQSEIAEDGKSEGAKQGRGRNRAKPGNDIAQVVVGKLTMECPERRCEEQNGDQESALSDKLVRHHSRPSLLFISDA
jgi:hypothetical protein